MGWVGSCLLGTWNTKLANVQVLIEVSPGARQVLKGQSRSVRRSRFEVKKQLVLHICISTSTTNPGQKYLGKEKKKSESSKRQNLNPLPSGNYLYSTYLVWWRRKWQPTPVFLPGESHGQRSLVGYSPWGHKESDMTERLHFLSYLVWVPGIILSNLERMQSVWEVVSRFANTILLYRQELSIFRFWYLRGSWNQPVPCRSLGMTVFNCQDTSKVILGEIFQKSAILRTQECLCASMAEPVRRKALRCFW